MTASRLAAGDLTAAIIAAHRSGWQVAAHAIGDRAIDLALDAYETAQARYPREDPRHRIEHFAATSPGQVTRSAALGVVAQEHLKGSITAGKLADLVVLSEDPTAVPADRIAGLAVLATYVAGECRYSSGTISGLS